MEKEFIVKALSIKLNKLLEKYADLYFDKITGNESVQNYGISQSTDHQMRKIEGEVNTIFEERKRLEMEMIEEFRIKDQEEFLKIKEEVENLSKKDEKEKEDDNE